MPVHNSDVANAFEKVADLLEIEGENPFRIRAYRDAARTVSGHSKSVAQMVEEGEDLSELPGIGEDLAGKIREIVETGTLSQLQELEGQTRSGLRELLDVPSLGRERIQELHRELDIEDLDDLERAAQEGKIQELPGYGEKTEQNILEGIEQARAGEGRTKLPIAEEAAGALEEYLNGIEAVDRAVVAGSYRRRQETVGDLDAVAVSENGEEVMDRFVEFEDVEEVLSHGETRTSVVLRSGLQVDLRVVPEESFGSALLYFTGSQPHHVALRDVALKRDLTFNEYGLFDDEDEQVAGKTEEEVYETLGYSYIEPELRENRGELEAAKEGELPELITLDDVCGNLHTHTTFTDGRNSLEEMARAAKDRGYEYLAITDHSKRLAMTGGLDENALREQMEEIERLDEELDGITLLKGIEVDILEDGSLDLSDEVLGDLDLVICSVHHKFDLSEKEQTERVLEALSNPNVNGLAHPTGRMIGSREPYEIDLHRVLEAAKENGCFLEVNASPERLDLDDIRCKIAKEAGVKLSIATDAHSVNDLDNMRFGIGQARRGWLEKEDVINTRTVKQLRKLLKKG